MASVKWLQAKVPFRGDAGFVALLCRQRSEGMAAVAKSFYIAQVLTRDAVNFEDDSASVTDLNCMDGHDERVYMFADHGSAYFVRIPGMGHTLGQRQEDLARAIQPNLSLPDSLYEARTEFAHAGDRIVCVFYVDASAPEDNLDVVDNWILAFATGSEWIRLTSKVRRRGKFDWPTVRSQPFQDYYDDTLPGHVYHVTEAVLSDLVHRERFDGFTPCPRTGIWTCSRSRRHVTGHIRRDVLQYVPTSQSSFLVRMAVDCSLCPSSTRCYSLPELADHHVAEHGAPSQDSVYSSYQPDIWKEECASNDDDVVF